VSRVAFKIRGMDCAEEVAVLKRELGRLVGGEDRLSFDLLRGKLTVDLSDSDLGEEAVRAAIGRTGMRATPWRDESSAMISTGFWQRRIRAALCLASGLLTVAAFALHGGLHGWLHALTGGEEPGEGFPAVSAVLYAAAIVSGCWFVAPKAVFAARRLRPDMNLLMCVAILGAIGIGEWFEAAAVAFLFALALLLESWSVSRARRAIGALMELSPAKARYICPHDGGIKEIPVEEVPVGASVLVRPGEKIPLDGKVIKGHTSVNQAPITGESIPVAKGPGDEVFAGTLNNQGAIEFESTKPADDTTLARIIHMVEEAQTRRAPSEQWVERFARYYTPLMMLLALSICVVPPLLGGPWNAWFYQALVILVIACPCALVISTPVTIVAGLTSAARAGVLIKGGVYLEAPAALRAVALDKTGTLTHGRPEVQRIVPLTGHTEAELLERAAAVESRSEHPLARAIVSRAQHDGVAYIPAESYQAIQGKGAEAMLEGRVFWLGSHRFAHEMAEEDPKVHQEALAMEDAGHSVVFVGNDDHVCGFISVADAVRPEAAPAVEALKQAGIARTVLLTGDNEGTARAVADAAGVDDCRPELLPEDKLAAVEALGREFGPVAMVGDGVNDAPAMAAASLGIAMGAAGTDAAIECADIALMSDDLNKLAWLVRHSRRTVRVIKQNIAFALGLKLAFIIMALFGAATLWMAIAADMGASLLVIFNGLRLLDGWHATKNAERENPVRSP